MYRDENEKAVHFAKSHIKQLVNPLPSRREDLDKQQELVDRRRKLLEREEKKLRDMEQDIEDSINDSNALKLLIAEIEMDRGSFPDLTDEQFKKRQEDIRWKIFDYTGTFTFLVPMGGF